MRSFAFMVIAISLCASACSGGKSGIVSPAASGSLPTSQASVTATSVPATTTTPLAPPIDYTDPATWLCRPDKTNTPCTQNLDSTSVGTSDPGVVTHFTADPSAPIDCFYVYPTVSAEQTDNSDMTTGSNEAFAVSNQAARFGSACRVFAPIYRQKTLALMARHGFASAQATAIAYGDVVAAWHDYLAHDNGGRGVVLIGHSQGAMLLKQLITDEIDGSQAVRSLLVSAIILGGEVHEQEYKNIPPCTKPGQVGCVIAYSSFDGSIPHPSLAMFGNALVLCTNPATLAGGSGALTSYFPSNTGFTATVSTPFFSYDDFSAECVKDAGYSYLKVTPPPGFTFPDWVTANGPSWGLHSVDFHLALGNLVAIVTQQAATFGKH